MGLKSSPIDPKNVAFLLGKGANELTQGILKSLCSYILIYYKILSFQTRITQEDAKKKKKKILGTANLAVPKLVRDYCPLPRS